MNRIEEALKEIFRNYGDSEEMRQLYHSILFDCKERYEDNLSHGMSEEEAYDSVMASLGDLDALLEKVDDENRKEEEEEHSYEERIDEIVIRVGSRDIALEGTDENDVTVEADPDMHQTVKGHVLYLDENTAANVSVGLLFAFHPAGDVSVSVPDGVRKITVSTTSGNVDLEDLRCETVLIQTVSGVVSGSLSSDGVDIHTSSGDAELDLNRVSHVHIVSASGDIELRGTGFMRAECRTTSGDVTVETDQAYELARINTVSGDVDIHKDQIDLDYHTVSGELTMRAERMQGWNRTEIRTVSGDIDIRR